MVVVTGGLNHREFAWAPRGGIADDREVVEEQLGVAALTTHARPEGQFAPASERDLARPDGSRLDLRSPDQVRGPAVRASRSHDLSFLATDYYVRSGD